MNHWYAVQTKPRQETTAEENLQRQGYETYLPRISLRKQRCNKWVVAVEPLFPRYLFIYVNPDEQSLAPIRSTLGVASLVRFGHLLRPVPNAVIDYLKQHEAPESQQLDALEWPHNPGDKLEVLEGPFAGLMGIYQKPLPEERALLLIELLGRQNTIEIQMQSLSTTH